MKNSVILLIFFISLLLNMPAQVNSADAKKGNDAKEVQQVNADKPVKEAKQIKETKRPKIGVVLSGGGAKGFAHIAVLRKLEELKIPVDYIAGTSMGSIIAGLYAMGYTPDEIEDIARNSDWDQYFTNKIDRDNISLIQKMYFYEYPVNLNVSKDGISAPKGLVNGQKTGLFLSRLSWGAQHINNYNELPIPFICIGTDFESGKQMIFNNGILAQSLRASMAIPSVFDPVEINGKGYIDGGVVNNFPIREVRDMGADIIIGVDVSSRLYTKAQLTSAPKIMEQAISYLGEGKTMEQRKLCDILIIPSVQEFGALDFARTDEIIKSGETATMLEIEKLNKLSAEMSSYVAEKRGRAISTGKESGIVIDKVKYNNLKLVSKSVIDKYLKIEKGDTVTVDQLEKSINMIYGLNYFERVHYNIDKEGDYNILNVNFEEKSEAQLSFGLAFDSDLREGLLVGLEVRNLLFKNTEAIVRGRVGQYKNLDMTYLIYTPFDPGAWFDANYNVYNMDVFLYQNGKKNAAYEFWYNAVSAGINSYYSNWFLLSLRVRQEFYDINADIASAVKDDNYNFDVLAFAAIATIDTLDRKSFSREGLFFEGEFDYVKAEDSFYTDTIPGEDFQRALCNFKFATPVAGRLVMQLGGAASTVNTDQAPPTYWFALGGAQNYENWIFPLNGYEMMEVTSTNGWMYFASLQYEFATNFFLTAKWNEGKVVRNKDKLIEYSDTASAYGGSLGYLAALGPIEASLFKKTESNNYMFHFSLGLMF